jgi:mxaD protein
MMRLVVAALCALLSLVATAENRSLLVVSEVVQIKAEPAKVWNFLKPFDSFGRWHPMLSASEIVSGRSGQIGALRVMTVKDGPKFTEELLAYNEESMAFTYNIIESPFPIDRYVATVSVKPDGQGGSIVLWVGQFSRKNPRIDASDKENDAAALAMITGAYKDGLQSLKKRME